MSGHRPWDEIKLKQLPPDLREQVERYYNRWWWRFVRRYDNWKEGRK